MHSPDNATLVGGGDGICLEGGATFRGRDVLVTRFAGAALQARGLEGRTPTFGPDPDYDTGEADAGEDRQ